MAAVFLHLAGSRFLGFLGLFLGVRIMGGDRVFSTSSVMFTSFWTLQCAADISATSLYANIDKRIQLMHVTLVSTLCTSMPRRPISICDALRWHFCHTELQAGGRCLLQAKDWRSRAFITEMLLLRLHKNVANGFAKLGIFLPESNASIKMHFSCNPVSAAKLYRRVRSV